MVFMKLKWEDVYDIFEEASIWENEHDMYWYRLIWSLIEYKNMNEYEDEYDKMRIYSRAFAIIKIYTDFIDESFNEIDDIFISSIDVYPYEMLEYLYDNADVREIFSVLNNELGTKRTFYSMFITCIEFQKDDDTDEDDEYPGEYYFNSEEYEDCEDDDEYENYEYTCDEDENYEYSDEYDDDDDDDDDEYDDEDYSEDYYDTFEEYIHTISMSSMSLLRDITPEKAAGYWYLASHMKSDL